ncbi:MAG: hypothetical protein LBS11_07975 [Oscillospiraceae bacterium]|jgi:formate C-acetyltransferase|nr:hypothetical protein [Oscillospiraceae bacterium]
MVNNTAAADADYGYDYERIERLRLETFASRFDYSPFSYYFYKGLAESDNGRPYALRVADAVYRMYENVSVYIGPDDLLAGRQSETPLTEAERDELDLLMDARRMMPSVNGQASHMAIDYELLLAKGAEGILEDIRSKREPLDLTVTTDVRKDIFYASCERALAGLIRFAERHADEARRQAEACPDPRRGQELLAIARNLSNVPRKPASGFYEAIQSVQFVTFALSGKPFMRGSHLYQLGRPDRYLLPFYERDLREGRITPYEAQTLIDCLAILMPARIPQGLAAGWMVGGRDRSGHAVSNDLTRMSLRSISHTRLVYPGIGLCWCLDTPEEDLRLACEILGEGRSHPALFNDEVISKGLRFHGMPDEDSHEYIHSTCVEITPVASSNAWVASPYMNLAQKLLDVLDRDYPSMDALVDSYCAHIAEGMRDNLIRETLWREERARYVTDPLLSCFVSDCLERGVDIEAGGARYNWIMPSFVGLSNAADALTVIERLVFHGDVSFETLRSALAADYVGYEQLRLRVMNTVPKYGNDDDAADKYALLLTERLTAMAEQYQRRGDGQSPSRGDNYLVPSLFCWVMHDEFGRETGASPDGRRAGFPLGDGSGPAQGREATGPTAAILSSTKWDHHKFIGGVAVNVKFSKRMFSPDAIGKMVSLVRTYFERGGFELQVNVVDRETLLKARANPEEYRDLLVRIGGYSDYFVRLTKTMQEELLARSEYLI